MLKGAEKVRRAIGLLEEILLVERLQRFQLLSRWENQIGSHDVSLSALGSLMGMYERQKRIPLHEIPLCPSFQEAAYCPLPPRWPSVLPSGSVMDTKIPPGVPSIMPLAVTFTLSPNFIVERVQPAGIR